MDSTRALTVGNVFFAFYHLCAVDLTPLGSDNRRRYFQHVSLVVIVLIVVQSLAHFVTIIFYDLTPFDVSDDEDDIPVHTKTYVRNLLESSRHSLLKLSTAVSIIYLYVKSESLRTLLAVLYSEWNRLRPEKELINTTAIHVVPSVFLVCIHFLVSCRLWYELHATTDSPTRYIGTASFVSGEQMVKYLSPHVQLIYCYVDSYAYVFGVYGGRLAIAVVISISCQVFVSFVSNMNAKIIQLTRTIERLTVRATVAMEQVEEYYYSRVVEICALTLKVRKTYQHFVHAFSVPVLFTVGQDLMLGVIDIGLVVASDIGDDEQEDENGGRHVMSEFESREQTVNRAFSVMNKSLSWIPFVVLVCASSRLATATRETYAAIRTLESKLDLFNVVHGGELVHCVELKTYMPIIVTAGHMMYLKRKFILGYIVTLTSFVIVLVQFIPE